MYTLAKETLRRICCGDTPDVMGAPMAVQPLMMVKLNRSRHPAHHHIAAVTSGNSPEGEAALQLPNVGQGL